MIFEILCALLACGLIGFVVFYIKGTQTLKKSHENKEAMWQSEKQRTLQKALDSQRLSGDGLILHSDQGSQYTSKAFIEFCESVHVTQSMSTAGYPYDNAPMERYFNTLKNECTNLYEFRTEEELYRSVEEFAYVTYNHVRPHSYNAYRTPYQARTAV